MVTMKDWHEFQQFADSKLQTGNVGSLAELISEWESIRRAADDTVADIRQSHKDIEEGQVSPAADSFANARRQLEQN